MLLLALPLLLTVGTATPCPRDVEDSFENLERSIQDVERSLDDIGSRGTRVRIRRKLEKTRRRIKEARAQACRKNTVLNDAPSYVAPPPPPEPTRNLAPILTAADHRALMSAVKGEAFKESKINVLRAGMDGMCLTSLQAKAIVQLFSFQESKKIALKIMVPRIVDRTKSYQISSALTYLSTKKLLSQLLKNTQQASSCAP